MSHTCLSFLSTVPQVNIDPPGDRHVKAGSEVRIDCHITDVVQIPDYIFWYHDNVRVLDRMDPNLDVSNSLILAEIIEA